MANISISPISDSLFLLSIRRPARRTTRATSSDLALLPPTNRPNATWAEHMSLPLDTQYDTTEFPLFRKFPIELRTIVWDMAASPSEIISIEVVRPIVFEKGTNKTKLINGVKVPRQFSIKYLAFGVPVNMDGSYITRPDGKAFVRSGELGACQESRKIYLKAKPRFVRLLKTAGGGNIWFNPDTDTFAILRRGRFNLNQLRQRRRTPMPIFSGFEWVKRIAFEDENAASDKQVELLADQVTTDFAESIVEIEEEVFEVPNAEHTKDDDWLEAVDLEQEELAKELKRAKVGLLKVNGTQFRAGIQMIYFPLKEENLHGKIILEGEEGEEGSSGSTA